MKMSTSLLGTMNIEDSNIKEYEDTIKSLKDENNTLKYDLENAKSEINRLTVKNKNLDILIKYHQDQYKNNKIENNIK